MGLTGTMAEQNTRLRGRNTAKVYALALLCSGIVHAALFSPDWWSHVGPKAQRQSVSVALHTLAVSLEVVGPTHLQETDQRPTPRSSKPAPQQPLAKATAQDFPDEVREIPAKIHVSQPRSHSESVTTSTLAQQSSEQAAREIKPDITAEAQSKPEPPVKPAPMTNTATASRTSDEHIEQPVVVQPPSYHMGSMYNPDPVYPGLAKRRGWQGEVVLRVEVGPDGRSRHVEVQSSSGYPVLDHSALRTIRDEWQFEPARKNDLAVLGVTSVPVRFQLR